MDNGDPPKGRGCPNTSIDKTVVLAGPTAVLKANFRLEKSGNLSSVSNTGRVMILLADETS